MSTEPQRPPSQGPWGQTAPTVPAPQPQTGFELEPNPPAPGIDGQQPVPVWPTTGSGASTDERFSHRTYLIKKQYWKLFGVAFRIYDPSERLVFYSKQKALRLKEDIRLFTGEDMTREVLSIKARNILDFSATYDVVETATGQKLGALKRQGFRSLLQDEWQILDPHDRELGIIREDSTALAVIRRFIEMAAIFIPQTFHGTIGGRPVCIFKQQFNPFIGKIDMDFSADSGGLLDRRLGIAAAVLLCAIEGKQR